jgi:hypothetical protein
MPLLYVYSAGFRSRDRLKGLRGDGSSHFGVDPCGDWGRLGYFLRSGESMGAGMFGLGRGHCRISLLYRSAWI